MMYTITEEQLEELKFVSGVCKNTSEFIYRRLYKRDAPIDCNLNLLNDAGVKLFNIYKQLQEQKEGE